MDFFLRSPKPCSETAEVDVFDTDSNQVIASKKVSAGDMTSGNQWTKITVPVQLKNNHRLDFRVHWAGKCNLDVGTIRIR